MSYPEYKPEAKDHEIVYQSPNSYYTVKKTKGGFYYGERLGVDSVAFVLRSKQQDDKKPFGVIIEYKDPVERFMTTAFGGSIDAENYQDDLVKLVQDEVQEESGFVVERDDINYLDRVLCSTQQNQFVYLFVVNVDKQQQGEKTTTNPTEQLAQIHWVNPREIAQLNDWKTPTIYFKHLTKNI